MSEYKSASDQQDQSARGKKPNSRIWLLYSLVLTVLIMGWAFSLPFRSGGLSYVHSKDKTPGQETESDQDGIRPVQTESRADEFVAAAIAMDEAYMRQRRERSRLKQVPGRAEVKARWNQRQQWVMKQVEAIGSPEKGTIEWQEQQELLTSLEDSPF